MRLLVTGGAGFIGSHLVERLVAESHDVDVVDDLSTGRLAYLAGARANRTGELRVHTLDVRAGELDQLIGRRPPQVIVHLAAPAASAPFGEHFSVVTAGLVNLLAASAHHRVQRIVAVAGEDLYAPATAKQLPIVEAHPHRARSDAASCRAAMLPLLSAAHDLHGIDHVVLVLSDVYGPRGALRPNADQRGRDVLFVDDAVDALVRATTRGSAMCINIGSGTRLDSARAAVQLGWRAFTSLTDGLRRIDEAGETVQGV